MEALTCDPSDQDTSCTTCLKDSCCDEITACEADTECTCMALCELLGQGINCEDMCGADAPSNPLFVELVSCGAQSCAMACE